MSGLPPILRQVVAFAGVGVVATLCHYVVLVLLVEAKALPVVPASAVGALVGAIVGYRLNYRLAFDSSAPHGKTAPRYLIIAVLALGVNTFLMAVLHGHFSLPYLIAQIITTGIVFFLTFSANRLWTFR